MQKFLRSYCLSIFLLLTVFHSGSFAQFTINQNFKGNTVGSDIVLGGNPNTAFLTSGILDPVNDGWLRITGAQTSQKGFAYVNTPFPSTLGVSVDFEYKSWRHYNDGYNGADGFCVYLFDAAANFQLGGFGGSLGYAPGSGSSTGLAGGYLGVGIDEYGNFSTYTEGRVGGTGSNPRPNSIVLRGPTTNNSNTTNEYLASVQLQPNSGSNTNSVDYNTITSTRPTLQEFYRRVRILIQPIGTESNPLYKITATIRTSPIGQDYTVTYNISNPPPKNLKVGFSASTGGGVNNHEIRNLFVTTPGYVSIDKAVDKANAAVGDQLTYIVNAYNSTDAPLSNLVINDTLKNADGTPLSTGPGGNFTINSITYFDNGYNGSSSANFTTGVPKTSGFTNPFSDVLSMPANSRNTYLITGTVNARPPGGMITNSVKIDPTGSGITDQDLTNNSFTVNSTILSGDVDFVITKTLNNFCQNKTGGNSYAITVSNNGVNASSNGRDVTVKDTIPAGFSVTSIDADGWNRSNNGNIYTFRRDDKLNSTFSYPIITINVTPNTSAQTQYINGATVSYDDDESNTNNNRATVTLYEKLSPPTVTSPVVYCQNATAVALTATGTNLLWYDVPAGGTGTPTAPIPLTTSAGDTKYYVSQTNGLCETNLAEITVTVNPTPTAPSGDGTQTFCQSENPTLASLQVSGSNIKWYATPSGGTALPASTPLVNGTTYYASRTTGSCESTARLAITVTVNAAPTPTGSTTQNFCQIDNPTVASLQAAGTNIKWYANPTGGTPLDNNTALTNGTTYYAGQTVGSCATVVRLAVLVNIASPAAPAGNGQQSFCQSANPTVASLQATGTNVQWYSAASGGSALSAGTALVNGTTYYAGQTVSGCISVNRLPVLVTIYTTPTVANANVDQVQYNSGIFNLSANTAASGTGVWSVVSGSATIANPASPTSTATIAANSTATLAWTITNGVCAASTDNMVVTYTRQVDVAVTNTDGAITYTPGTNVTYTLTVTNNGPSDVIGLTVFDPLPAGITTASWSASSQGGATVSGSGTGGINQVINIPSGGTVICTSIYSVPAGFTGNLSHTLTATMPSGFTDINLANNTAADTDAPDLQYNVTAVKTAPATAIAGTPISFQIVFKNNGPSNMTAAAFADLIPASVTNVSWTATIQGSASVSSASGTGNNIAFTGNIAAGEANGITVTVNGTVSASATGTIVNTASVTPPGKPLVNSNTTTTVLQTQTGLQVVKTASTPGAMAAGLPIQYTVTITNAGPSDAVNIAIADIVPSDIIDVSWTVSTQGNASASTAGGTGNSINFTGNIEAGGGNAIIISVFGTVKSSVTGSVVNTATATAPGGSPVTGQNTTAMVRNTSLSITKTGPANAAAGSPVVYTITVSNNGPSDAVNINIRDIVPASIQTVSWTAVATGASTISAGASGTGNNVLVTGDIPFANGNTISVQVNGIIKSSEGGTIVNTASAELPLKPAVLASVTTNVLNQPGFLIAKSGPATINAGANITYTIEVANAGPSDAVGAVISDIVPAQITNVTWTTSVVQNGIVTEGATGSGNLVSVTGNLPAGTANRILVTVTGKVNPAFVGTFTNTGSIVSAGQSPVVSAPVTTVVTAKPNVTIQKTGPSTLAAGQDLNYTLVVSNSGPSNATGLVIADAIPVQLTNVSWSTELAGGASLTAGATGTGNTLNITGSLPSGEGNTITVNITGKVDPAFVGTFTNTATVGATGQSTVSSGPVVTNIFNQPGVTISKSGPSKISAGTIITYTLEVRNSGPSNAPGAVITDAVPAQITGVSWTATAPGAAAVTVGATGTGNALSVTGNIPAGMLNKILVTITGTVNPDFAGTFTNTGTVTPQGQAAIVSAPVVTVVSKVADIKILKSGPESIVAGQDIVYTIIAGNAGPSNANNVSVQDVVPTDIENVTWSAVVSGTATINGAASGTGNTIALSSNMPAGTANRITITIKGRVKSSSLATQLVNTATATPEAGTTDATPATSTVTTAVSRQSDLRIVVFGPADKAVNQQVRYQMIVTNAGPSDVTNAVIRDLVPSQVTGLTSSIIATGNASATGSFQGNAFLSTNASLRANSGDVLTITITGTATTEGLAKNTATVTLPAGITDENISNNSSSVTTNISTDVGVLISKSGSENANIGEVVNYTIEVTNTGASNALGVIITDPVPAAISAVTWNAVATGNGATTITSSSAGAGNNISLTGNIEGTTNGPGLITINVSGIVNASAGTTFTNTAMAEFGGITRTSSSASVANNSANLRIVKSGPTSAKAGDRIVYTISAFNLGPANSVAASISDVIPATVTNVSWQAVSAGAAVINGASTGTTNTILISADLPAGSANNILVTVTGIISPTFSGTIINTATIVPTDGKPNTVPSLATSTVRTVVTIDPSLQVVKSGPSSVSAGQTFAYTVDVTNNGPSTASGLVITDLVPAQLLNVSWTAAASGVATISAGATGTGNTVSVTGNLPAADGNKITITITGTMNPAFTGSITNEATATPQTGTAIISDPVVTTVVNTPVLSIQKYGPTTANAGDRINYALRIFNTGLSDAKTVTIADVIPLQITNTAWYAVATGTAVIAGGPLSGQSGNVNFIADIPAGANNIVTVVITGIVNPDFVGTLTNTATATPAGKPTVNSPVITTQIVNTAALQIIKSGPPSVVAGQNVTYTFDVTNNGPSNANNMVITDAVPVQLQNVSWTTKTIGGVVIASGATGTGNTVSVTGNIPAGSAHGIRVIVTGTMDPNYIGTVTNTAVVTPQSGTPVTSNPVVTLVIRKVAVELRKFAPAAVIAGNTIQFGVLITNTGRSTTGNMAISDVIPSSVQNVSWKSQAFGTATINGATTGTGNNVSLNVTIPGGGGNNFIALVITGTVNPTFAGTINNTATASIVGDPDVSSNTTATNVVQNAELGIIKTGPVSVFENNPIVWRIQVINNGLSPANGATITDIIPASVTNATVQVIGTSGGAAGVAAAINGNTMSALIATLPAGGQCVLEVTGLVRNGTISDIVNTATVATPAGITDPYISNNSSQVQTSVIPKTQLRIRKAVLSNTPYFIGQNITYSIKVYNPGGVGVKTVGMVDVLPPITHIAAPVIASVTTGTASYNATANTINWNIGYMAAGDSTQILYTATILDSGTLVNTAIVAASPSVSLPDTSIASIFTSRYADLAVTKTLNSPKPYSVGKNITFTITVRNNGPNSATGVVMSDVLPANLDRVINMVSSAGTANYSLVNNRIDWNIGNLAVNATVTLTFELRVNSGGNITNTATVTGNERDHILSNNSASIIAEPITGEFLFIPNVITPNADGKNDRFVILGLNRYPNSDMTIYNRWNNLVYHSPNYANDWDAKGLSEGTYYYVLKLNTPTGIDIRKGWILVKSAR